MNINTLDLNLLKVFDAIYQTRNVTAAANNIGLAQSSMSNALSRLRTQFDDPLFHRSGKGVTPTEKAEELAPQVQAILANINTMITPNVFDPSKSSEQITIAASDSIVALLAPKLIPVLREKAPGIFLNFVPLNKNSAFEQLDEQALQIVIGTFSKVPARFNRKKLHNEKFICIKRKNHIHPNKAITLESYTQSSHILMTLKADQIGVIDKALKQLGLSRHIAMTCAQFLPLVEVVANSDLIATIPCSLSKIAQDAGCEPHPLPLDIPSWNSELVVSQRFYTSEVGRFLIDILVQLEL